MIRRAAPALAAAVLLVGALVGCAPEGETPPTTSPSPTTASPTASSPAPTPEPTGGDSMRFLITCVAPDGAEIATFTRLEEAWASTNYLRIDHCDALTARDGVELTVEERDVAKTASVDLPDEDPLELFLQTLATCVRVSTGTDGMTALPTSLIRATLELCPEAPQAGLLDAELSSRGAS